MASDSGTLYTGVTNNIERRIYEHASGLIPGFTKKYQCNKLVYLEYFTDIQDAIQREKYIKGKKRIFKETLIKSMNPGWRDLSKRDSSLCSE
jgi:putative endonuclease